MNKQTLSMISQKISILIGTCRQKIVNAIKEMINQLVFYNLLTLPTQPWLFNAIKSYNQYYLNWIFLYVLIICFRDKLYLNYIIYLVIPTPVEQTNTHYLYFRMNKE